MRRSDWYYTPSTPISTEDGIKAQSKSGSFASNWWAKRWLAALKAIGASSRLNRGKRYARSGQVLSIDIDKGFITAQVQGSRKKPYTCVVQVPELPAKKWQAVANRIIQSPALVAQLLAGTLPEVIEQVFVEAGTWLFPTSRAELQTDCSCPDWENPCKHLAAVCFLLGEEFDRDPWQYLMFRGATRDELLEYLQPGQALSQNNEGEPLPVAPDAFWSGGALPGDLGQLNAGEQLESSLERLGPFPLWRGDTPLGLLLQPVYMCAKEMALQILAGDDAWPDGESAATDVLDTNESDPQWDLEFIAQAARITNITANRDEFTQMLQFALAQLDFPWTPPERQVALKYCEGMSQADVGRALGIRCDYVRHHLLAIAKKVRMMLDT